MTDHCGFGYQSARPSFPQVAAEAAADIQRLQTEVLTENNVKALRESVQTLTKTLQHIERITGERILLHTSLSRQCSRR